MRVGPQALLAVWRALTRPHDGIVGTWQDSQARITAGVALLNAAATLLLLSVARAYAPPGAPLWDPLTQSLGLAITLYLVGYVAARGRRPSLGGWLVTGGVGAGVWLLVATSGAPWSSTQALTLLIPLIASLVLDPLGLVVAGGANLLWFGLYSAGWVGPGGNRTDLLMALLLGLVTIILLVAQAQRQAQQRRIEAQAARLAAEEADLLALLDAAPQAMLTADVDGRVRYANQPAAKLLGYTRRELQGMNTEALLPREQRQRHAQQRASFHADPAPRLIGHNRDLRALRKDGAEVPVEIGLNTLKSRGERLVVVSLVDLTLRRQAERLAIEAVQHDAALQKAAAVAKFRADLMNQVAHELKNPLTPLQLQTKILAMAVADLPDPEQGHKAIAMMERSIGRLRTEIEHMLEAARLESGTTKLQLKALDLRRVVQDACDSYAPVAEAAGLVLHCDASAPLQVQADGGRLEAVVDNLVSNAVKYTPAPGTIRVATGQQQGKASVRVTDSGLGLTNEQLERLFVPFSRVHTPVQKGATSTGLGLFISKGVVELHGGRMGAESEGHGKGCTFWFEVPLQGSVTPQPVASPGLAQ